jgi:uncharacterized protein YbjT (DUF2867 family)
MTVAPILVTGATGRIGRRVVDALVADGTPVRALTRTPSGARLPAAVEVVTGDLTLPATLDAGRADRAAHLAAPRVLHDDVHASRDYVLTGPESLSQAEQVRIIGSAVGRDIAFDDVPPEGLPPRSAGHLAGAGAGHAHGRLGRDARAPGVRHLDGGRRAGPTGAHVRAVGT